MNSKVEILNVYVDRVTMKEAVDKLFEYLNGSICRMVFTINPEIIMATQKNKELLSIINKSDLVTPDGIGVVIASKILKNKLPERVAGYDLIQNLFELIKNKDYNVYFLGAAPGVAQKAAEEMKKKFKGLNIVGFHDGYFKESNEIDIVEEINNLGTDILLVGLGAPKQEKWINKYKNKLKTKVCVGVGGSFDGMSGKVKRAPIIFQKLGLEWFYRLITQPTRAKRMMQLPLFIIKVLQKRRNDG